MKSWFVDGDGWMRRWTIPASIIATFALLVGLAVWGGTERNKAACRQVGTKAHVRTQYAYNTGCWVQVGGKWVPQDTWRMNTGN